MAIRFLDPQVLVKVDLEVQGLMREAAAHEKAGRHAKALVARKKALRLLERITKIQEKARRKR